ncbi:SecY-interacting protein [Shewanella intestini]|uniref:Protein Syd n=1 Tax=Shewanella intestini TaxID=2017544 RepID=A0ABS5I048_9GAMM|nr:SecY-interacting protein [Shewanella sp. XMDDZSB0408]MBR9727377.1 SecY-interacting protein [Shewanella intestini]MRG35573.1 SecY-interacting protein [Shewanella sp. XMDDZSB0408]
MSCSSAFDIFIDLYLKTYQTSLSELPRYYPLGEASPCVEAQVAELDNVVYWQPHKRQSAGNFDNVATALEVTLHPDIDAFFGRYYAAPLNFISPWGDGELLQAWNQQDYEYLQQNMIGHLMMKKKLKQPATWFIGVLGEGDQMLTVNNEDGSVWIEIPGEVPTQQLAPSLAEFIEQLQVLVKPPVEPVEEVDEVVSHPGIWHRLKVMWGNLMGHSNK